MDRGAMGAAGAAGAVGDTHHEAPPVVVRNSQQWESFKECDALIVVELFPSWAAPSTALASAVQRMAPQIESGLLFATAMPTDTATAIFRMSKKPVPGIALAYRGLIVKTLPAWDIGALKKAVLDFFNRGKSKKYPPPLKPLKPLQARSIPTNPRGAQLIHNLADAVRSSRAVERMRKQIAANDDEGPRSRWQPPQYKKTK